MIENSSLAARITDSRIGAGLTIEQAAQKVGVKTSTFKKWESGEISPRANRLQMLAGVFSVSLIWLLNGRKDLDPQEHSLDTCKQRQMKHLQRIKLLQRELATEIANLENCLHTLYGQSH